MKEKLSKAFDWLYYTVIALGVFLVLLVGSGKAVHHDLCWKVIQNTIGDEGYRWLYNRTLILEGRYYSYKEDWQTAHDKYLEAYNYDNTQKGLFGKIWATQLKMMRSKEAYSDWIFYHENTSLKNGAHLRRGSDYAVLLHKRLSPSYLNYVIESQDFKDVAYLQRGLDLCVAGQYAAAEMDFSRAINKNPKLSLAYFYRGWTRSTLGDWKGADADYAKAEELEPGSSLVLENRAANLIRMKDWDKALQKINTAMLYRPGEVDLYLGRSRINLALGNTEAAHQDFEKSMQLYDKPNWILLMTKGYYQELEGNKTSAWSFYNQADKMLEASFEDSRQVFSNVLAREIGRKRQLRQELVMDKPYNLDQLLQEVVEQQFKGNREGINSIAWTKVPNDEYYGVTKGSSGDIKISCQLNSSQVPRECVKFVIYHECLHAKTYLNHDPHFYDMEGKYPDAKKWNKLLDYKMVYCYEPKWVNR